jgi:hypothetical protein
MYYKGTSPMKKVATKSEQIKFEFPEMETLESLYEFMKESVDRQVKEAGLLIYKAHIDDEVKKLTGERERGTIKDLQGIATKRQIHRSSIPADDSRCQYTQLPGSNPGRRRWMWKCRWDVDGQTNGKSHCCSTLEKTVTSLNVKAYREPSQEKSGSIILSQISSTQHLSTSTIAGGIEHRG